MVEGHKRHFLVDALDLLLVVIVTAANQGDRQGLIMLLADYFARGVKRWCRIWVDSGDAGVAIKNWVLGLKRFSSR